MSSYNLKDHVSYQNLINKSFKLKIKSEDNKEEKRLLYVALTRAKNYLTIIGSSKSEKLQALKTDYDIYSSNNFLSWIVGCLNEHEIISLKTNNILMQSIHNSSVQFNIIKRDEINFTKNSKKEKQQKFSIKENKIIDILSQKFIHNNLSKKSSVSQIMEQEEHYNITDLSAFHNDKLNDLDFLAIGTAYHKYMELINFSNESEKIEQQMEYLKQKNVISAEESRIVDEGKIQKAIFEISTLINVDDIVYKEKQFLCYFPANQLVKTDKKNKVLVQGVADLIIIKSDQIILVDYKTSRLKESEFSKKYKTQLDIYAKAIELFYNKKVSKKFIYSFYLDKLITI